MSGRFLQLTNEAPTGQGAAARFGAMDCEQAVVAGQCPAEEALAMRDQALAALDGGGPRAALAIARAGLAALQVAGLGGGPDAAALLVALAEIEESADPFDDADVTIAAAIAILEDIVPEGGDDILMLWCQAQE